MLCSVIDYTLYNECACVHVAIAYAMASTSTFPLLSTIWTKWFMLCGANRARKWKHWFPWNNPRLRANIKMKIGKHLRNHSHANKIQLLQILSDILKCCLNHQRMNKQNSAPHHQMLMQKDMLSVNFDFIIGMNHFIFDLDMMIYLWNCKLAMEKVSHCQTTAAIHIMGRCVLSVCYHQEHQFHFSHFQVLFSISQFIFISHLILFAFRLSTLAY